MMSTNTKMNNPGAKRRQSDAGASTSSYYTANDDNANNEQTVRAKIKQLPDPIRDPRTHYYINHMGHNIFEHTDRPILDCDPIIQCIPSNGKMTRGFLRTIAQMHPEMSGEISQLRPPIGSVVVYPTIINLITKKIHYDKPELIHITTSLINLKTYLISKKIKQIHIPRIGAFDEHPWDIIMRLFASIFMDAQIKIVVHQMPCYMNTANISSFIGGDGGVFQYTKQSPNKNVDDNHEKSTKNKITSKIKHEVPQTNKNEKSCPTQYTINGHSIKQFKDLLKVCNNLNTLATTALHPELIRSIVTTKLKIYQDLFTTPLNDDNINREMEHMRMVNNNHKISIQTENMRKNVKISSELTNISGKPMLYSDKMDGDKLQTSIIIPPEPSKETKSVDKTKIKSSNINTTEIKQIMASGYHTGGMSREQYHSQLYNYARGIDPLIITPAQQNASYYLDYAKNYKKNYRDYLL